MKPPDTRRWFSAPPERQRPAADAPVTQPPTLKHSLPPEPAAVPAPERASKRLLNAAQPAASRRTRAPLRPGDEDFLHAVRAAQQLEPRRAPRIALWLMAVTIGLVALWAATTRVEQITRAEGRVIPETREQVISSLEGGLLAELLVREGEAVRAGQPLLRIDPTRAESSQNEGAARRLALLATTARLQAEVQGREPRFPDELKDQPRLVAMETEAFQARRRLLEEAVGANRQSIALVGKELAVAEDMAQRGLMSEVEVVRLRRQINDMQQQMLERRNRFRQDASTELLRVQGELAQLDEQMVAREDAVRRTVVNSPVDGLVKNIRQHTLGGVISPGAPILEIVPRSEHLLVEMRLKPADVGFVRIGQAAEVKLSAYDYNLYGGLSGTVESISPDALGEAERPPNAPDATWFRALVRIQTNHLRSADQVLPVIPGMTATVEVNTGERTVLEFVLRPLLKAREAFRER
ncbi:HlyD family type I secretion periplasmic adaptor subunit [Ideonella sp. 4Y11]|uniref:Membrane fusion protein (MFP) family protein n=1 Tax=Ideonella aquatica TaxID=2824119 RepID=A0A940YSS3_9BURK|nr:HlyD family type I secretion periplasmic adaptor subunit [Ideonella aquatica]MBQ0961786.1 HlyD family type I secretion periplasmic adaptor subunit [Ideonella aquatica]